MDFLFNPDRLSGSDDLQSKQSPLQEIDDFGQRMQERHYTLWHQCHIENIDYFCEILLRRRQPEFRTRSTKIR